MIAHQHITKIIAGVVAVAVGLCLAAVLFAGAAGASRWSTPRSSLTPTRP